MGGRSDGLLRNFGVIAVALWVSVLLSAAISWTSWAQNFPNSLNAPEAVGVPPTLGAPPIFHGNATSAPSRNVAARPSGSQTGNADTVDYRLGAGDRVRITVFGQQDLTGTYSIDGSGDLSFPLVGQIHAGGMTGSDLQQALAAKLSPEYIKNPSINVEVLTYRPFYILGEVRTPGSYPYVFGMTVLHAIAIAGGFTYRAREGDFVLTRTGQRGNKEHLDATQDTPVEPGDIITVRERYF
jgi:protein involved in polysaccharide export with SLBB domain